MTIETATYITDLNAAYPGATDLKSEGDDHIRLVKAVVKTTFPNVNGVVNPTPTEFNYVVGVTSAIQTQFAARLTLTGGTITGPLIAGSGANGSVTLAVGDSAHTGYVAFTPASGVRQGFIGFSTTSASADTGTIQFVMGTAAFNNAVTATTFNGKLATANISQWTNDAGYITSAGAAAAGSLTGTTMAANVVASSLTSFGVSPVLGTPASGNLANCTFPTLNQNTSGSSGSTTGNAATATTAAACSGNAATATTAAACSGNAASASNVLAGATDGTNELGFKGLPSASVTSGAFAASDKGKCVYATAGVTVPNATMALGDVVTIINTTAASITITATVTTLRQAGTANVGNRTLAAYGMASVVFASGTLAFINGAGLT